jgi:hypothetical protein
MSLLGDLSMHGSRHRRKHPKGRRKVGRKKRRLLRRRRAMRTGGK